MKAEQIAKLSFDQLIGKFRVATQASLELAETLSKMALTHFKEHGDTAYINRFLDAMPKNYLRRGAFEKWCKDFSPLMKVDGVFVKDKSEKANKFNLEEAFKKPFWEHNPDREVVFWEETDIVVSLQRALKRFDNTKSFKPANAKATKALEHFKSMVNQLAKAKEAEEKEETKEAVAA